MLRVTRPIVVAALACLLFAATASAGPDAFLTVPEYQQLSSAQAHLKTVVRPTARGLSAAVQVCEQMPQLTPLLTLERSSCIYDVNLARTGLQAESVGRSCSAQAKGSEQIVCALPSYRAMRTAARDLLQADRETDSNIRERGFNSSCAAALGNEPELLRKERHVAADLDHLIAAMRTFSQSATKTYANRLISDSTAEVSAQMVGPRSLAACPHARVES